MKMAVLLGTVSSLEEASGHGYDDGATMAELGPKRGWREGEETKLGLVRMVGVAL